MSSTPNAITPRQFAVSLIQHEVEDVERRIYEHIRHRNQDDLFNSEIRVFLERTGELLMRAAELLQDDPEPGG
jgi:fibrillarin-like rRNA methylase